MSAPRPELALERILAALEAELIAARDDEIMDAAKDLGMNPAMKGSAAFTDIRILLAPRQFRTYSSGAPESDGADDAQKNGAPIARIFVKRDAPPSR
jgi:hypothetical protein